MHALLSGKVKSTESLKEFQISAFIEVNSSVLFKSETVYFDVSTNVVHIVL